MSDQFEIGDTVQLKSGGPIMTVRAVRGDTVRVNWFDSDDSPKQEDFSASQLKAYDEPPPSFEPDGD